MVKMCGMQSSDLGPYVDAGHLDQRRFHHLDAESGGSECVPDSAHQRVRKGNSALVGLVVHAAADGLAVGAASMSPSTRLALLVGVAMVLHKGPVAFGLTTFLRGCKWSWREIGRVRFGSMRACMHSNDCAAAVLPLVTVTQSG